jgi:hypothetical protein
VKPYLDRLETEKREAAEAARKIAEQAQMEAAAAAKAAGANDLAAQEAAEEKIAEAAKLQAAANRAANDKAQARGGSRAMGLTRTYTPVMTDRKAALLHYLAAQPDAIVACLQGLAEADVREGKRQIPGFEIKEGTRL